jgi:hypothetical protein
MTNHVLCNEHWNVPSAVMNGDRVTDHIGEYRRCARPRSQYAPIPRFVHLTHPRNQALLNPWTLF